MRKRIIASFRKSHSDNDLILSEELQTFRLPKSLSLTRPESSVGGALSR
jgi:hypothetical protein